MPTAIEIAVEMNVDLLEVTQALMAGNAYRTNSLDAAADDDENSIAAQVTETLGDVDPAYDITDDALAVAPLLRDLSERDRRILHLRFYENCTQSQIARELGVSQMHISRILARTLATLRERALRD